MAIRSLRHWLNGVRYHRAPTPDATDYFLHRIREEYGNLGLQRPSQDFPLISTTATQPAWQCPACRPFCRNIAASRDQGVSRGDLHHRTHPEAARGIGLSTIAPRSSIVRTSLRSHDARASTAPETSLSRPRKTHSQTIPTRQPAASNV